MAGRSSPALSASQLEKLADLGEECTAGIGDVLYRVGDATYPLIAIQDGEVAILDAAGNELVRHGASSFLGELNLHQIAERAVLEEQVAQDVAVDRDVAQRLGHDRAQEDGLARKRCAAAVGEGSMAVQFVHKHLAAHPAGVP